MTESAAIQDYVGLCGMGGANGAGEGSGQLQAVMV